MQASAERWIDDLPPESGVRRAAPRPRTRAAEPELFEEIGKQVFLEVWDLMLALAPLQGAWFSIGIGQIGAIAVRVLGWELEEAEAPTGARATKRRARWPELVPGYAAMDRLVGLMVDVLCR